MRTPLLCAAALLVACGGKKVIIEDRYYSLVLEAAEDAQDARGAQDPTARVDLVEVRLPDYLMLRNLTLQTSSNEITIAKHHHWAEPLDEAVRKVIIWDLSAGLPALDVTHGPGKDADCTLSVEFDRLHPNNAGRVLASGRYAFTSQGQTTRREFDVSQPLWADGYTSAVAVMRQALTALSQEMQPTVQGCTPDKDEAPEE